jgi:hypothetical protein
MRSILICGPPSCRGRFAYPSLLDNKRVHTARALERAAQQGFAVPRSCHQAVAFLQFHAMPPVSAAVSE